MKPIVYLNLAIALVSFLLPNDFLAWNSFVIYGAQAASLAPFVFKKIKHLSNVFLPTLFALIYFLVNFILGSYLVPRGYGWNKDFALEVVYNPHYNVIVPFFVLCNLLLFVLSCRSLDAVAEIGKAQGDRPPVATTDGLEMPKAGLYFAAFFATGYFELFSAFSFQLALMIIHLTGMNMRRSVLRYVAYAFYLSALVVFSFENKREIIMALFLVVFLEAYFRGLRVRVTPSALAIYAIVATVFFATIVVSSILRGYGDYPISGPLDAIRFVPDYVTSDLFVDGITDNLELNYNYGVAVTSIGLVLDGRLEYQIGASFLKILFLPIPREIFPDKPDSVLQLFTQEYAPGWWAVGGSMPVMFESEMFVNFHYGALLAVFFVMKMLDAMFIEWHRGDKLSVKAICYLFLVITVLMLARGSGVEQYLVYLFFAVPVFLFYGLTRGTGVGTRKVLSGV